MPNAYLTKTECSFSKTRFHSYTVSKYAHFKILFFGLPKNCNCLLAIFHNHNASCARQSNWIIKMLNNLTKYENKKTDKLFLLMRKNMSEKRRSLKDTLDESRKKTIIRFHTLGSIHWMNECTALNIFLNSSIIIHLIALFHYMVAKYLGEYLFFSSLKHEFKVVWCGLMKVSWDTVHVSIVLQIGDSVKFANMTKKQNPKYEMA